MAPPHMPGWTALLPERRNGPPSEGRPVPANSPHSQGAALNKSATGRQRPATYTAVFSRRRGKPGPIWLRDVEAHPDTAALRADSLRTLRAVSWALAVRARADGTSAPTWDGLAEATGLSRASIARWLAWLVERDLLARTTTPRGAGISRRDPAAVAQVYALTGASLEAPAEDISGVIADQTGDEAPVEELETLTLSSVGGHPSHERARAIRGNPPPDGGGWLRHATTRTRGDELAAAAALQVEVIALRRVSARAVRAVVRPLLRQGWTVADLRHALEHEPPTGTGLLVLRWQTADVRLPAGWLRHRLAAWADHQPPSALRADERAALRAEQQRLREAHETARVHAVGMPDEVRDLMRHRSLRAAEPTTRARNRA